MGFTCIFTTWMSLSSSSLFHVKLGWNSSLSYVVSGQDQHLDEGNLHKTHQFLDDQEAAEGKSALDHVCLTNILQTFVSGTKFSTVNCYFVNSGLDYCSACYSKLLLRATLKP